MNQLELQPQLRMQPAPDGPDVLFVGEAQPVVQESAPWDQEARLNHLLSLPTSGFETSHWANTVDMIVATGLPVNNYQRISFKPNQPGRENVVGTWGGGEMSFYEHLNEISAERPEEVIKTVVHEGVHANTPLDEANDALYGGRAERMEALDTALDVTRQSLVTGVHLDGYHKSLIEQYEAGDITMGRLVEETHAILGEMALLDRNGLAIVQERQQRKLEDYNRIHRNNPEEQIGFTPLMSTTDRKGNVQLAGIDKTLVKLIDGVEDYNGLVDHAHDLKAGTYSQRAMLVVRQREALRNEDYEDYLALIAVLRVLRNQFDLINKQNEDKEDEEVAAA